MDRCVVEGEHGCVDDAALMTQGGCGSAQTDGNPTALDPSTPGWLGCLNWQTGHWISGIMH